MVKLGPIIARFPRGEGSNPCRGRINFCNLSKVMTFWVFTIFLNFLSNSVESGEISSHVVLLCVWGGGGWMGGGCKDRQWGGRGWLGGGGGGGNGDWFQKILKIFHSGAAQSSIKTTFLLSNPSSHPFSPPIPIPKRNNKQLPHW